MPLPHGCKWPHLGALFEVQWAPAGANAAPSADGGGLTVRSAWPCTRRLPFDPLDGVSYCTGTVGPGVCRGVAVPPPFRWSVGAPLPNAENGGGSGRILWLPMHQIPNSLGPLRAVLRAGAFSHGCLALPGIISHVAPGPGLRGTVSALPPPPRWSSLSTFPLITSLGSGAVCPTNQGSSGILKRKIPEIHGNSRKYRKPQNQENHGNRTARKYMICLTACCIWHLFSDV